MSKSTKFRVYEVVCRDKKIKDRYLGYTSMTKQVFIECQQGIVRDKETGRKVDLGDTKQPPSRLQEFVSEHGGWNNWNFRVFPRLWDSKHEANLVKEIILNKYPEKYTLNIYKTAKKRAPVQKTFDFDSDEESVATDD
jgi:hypothetical protein